MFYSPKQDGPTFKSEVWSAFFNLYGYSIKMDKFNYVEAFSRNIGWLTKNEQLILKNSRVAIAGMGGVGGAHLLTLCRLGIEHFHIADPDIFQLANFNRQLGATLSSLNKPKTQTLFEMAKEINPNVDISIFDSVTKENVDTFLENCDIYVDGMDFFCLDTRELLFLSCDKWKIPAITAAPVGLGVNYLIFDQLGMRFSDYFCLENKTEKQRLLNFILGLAPKPMHLGYLVDPSAIKLDEKKGPSTVMACMLCAGVAGVQVLRILLKRGKIYSAPYYHVFDPYSGRFQRGYLVQGNKNPLQYFKRIIAEKIYSRQQNQDKAHELLVLTDIEKIIDLARWAPSPWNIQPWRFKALTAKQFIISIEDPLKVDKDKFYHMLLWLSAGALIENIKLAANKYNHGLTWSLEENTIKISIKPRKEDTDPLALADFIESRVYDSGDYEKYSPPLFLLRKLSSLVDENTCLTVISDKTIANKISKLNQYSADIFSLLPQTQLLYEKLKTLQSNKTETIAVSNKMIKKWGQMISGNPIANKVKSYFHALNRKNAAGYIVISAKKPVSDMTIADYLESGMQLERLWLFLTQKKLAMQPYFLAIGLLSFYKNEVELVENRALNKAISHLALQFKLLGLNENTIAIIRFGYPKYRKKRSRNLRLSLKQLIKSESCEK